MNRVFLPCQGISLSSKWFLFQDLWYIPVNLSQSLLFWVLVAWVPAFRGCGCCSSTTTPPLRHRWGWAGSSALYLAAPWFPNSFRTPNNTRHRRVEHSNFALLFKNLTHTHTTLFPTASGRTKRYFRAFSVQNNHNFFLTSRSFFVLLYIFLFIYLIFLLGYL